MVSMKIFEVFIIMGANDPRGMANLDPRAWLAGFRKVTT